jgi:hypothetical protein
VVVLPEVVEVVNSKFGGVRSISHVPATSAPTICSVKSVPAVTPYAVIADADRLPVVVRLVMVAVPVAFRLVVVNPEVTLRFATVVVPVAFRLIVVIPLVPVTFSAGVVTFVLATSVVAVTLVVAVRFPTMSVLPLKKLVLDNLSNTFLDALPSRYGTCLLGGGIRVRMREGCGVGRRIAPGRVVSPFPEVVLNVKLNVGSKATLTAEEALYRLSSVDM